MIVNRLELWISGWKMQCIIIIIIIIIVQGWMGTL